VGSTTLRAARCLSRAWRSWVNVNASTSREFAAKCPQPCHLFLFERMGSFDVLLVLRHASTARGASAGSSARRYGYGRCAPSRNRRTRCPGHRKSRRIRRQNGYLVIWTPTLPERAPPYRSKPRAYDDESEFFCGQSKPSGRHSSGHAAVAVLRRTSHAPRRSARRSQVQYLALSYLNSS